MKVLWSKFKPATHEHRARTHLAPSTKHRIAVAIATANRKRPSKPVTLAKTPWELTREKK